MGSMINNFFGKAADQSTDQTLAFSAMSSAAASCSAYLAATLEATTPEVRRLFAEYLSQSIIGHEGVTELMIKKGWAKPYDAPIDQLGMSCQQSQSVMDNVQ